MTSMKLPADLGAFLEARQRLEYEPWTCEAGKVTLLPRKRLKLELFPMESADTPFEEKDPHYGEEGCYLVPAVKLVTKCDQFDPVGLLLWLPEEGRYGTWNRTSAVIHLFAAGVTWTTITQDPARYLNSQWGVGARNRRPVQTEWLVPWPKYRYSDEPADEPRRVPKSPFPDLPEAEVRAFLTAIHETPDDDTPRLVFADWLEEHDDPRGEFFRIQCIVARLDKNEGSYKEWQTRERQWLKRYRKGWDEELGGVVSSFERGLPVAGDDDETGMGLRPARVSGPLLGQLAIGWPSCVWLWLTDKQDLAALLSPPWSEAVSPLRLNVSEDFPVTKATLTKIAGLKRVRSLGLGLSDVTSAGLAPVSGLTDLETLGLDNTPVGDAALAHLTELTHLRKLELWNTEVTDVGLPHLAGLRRLQSLDLSGNRVTDAGLAHLVGLTGLESLYLSDTGITDAGLQYLAGFRDLKRLVLDDTAVTDAGLAHLRGLARLAVLLVRETQVTPRGTRALRKALPRLRIYA